MVVCFEALNYLCAVILRRAPEARLEGCMARAVALRGSLRSHLKVTVMEPCELLGFKANVH